MEECSESEASIAFTNASLAYTISDVDLVAGWLQGKSPHGTTHSRSTDYLATPSVSQYRSTTSRSRLVRSIRDLRIMDSMSSLGRRLQYGEDENKERGNWTGRMDFVLSMLGYAVGLGNIWRFPYLCYRNGGGAFLLPYLLMLGLVGLPLFYLEVCLGQFCSRGAAKCWQFAPIFKGVGVAMIVASTMVSIYYNMIIAWAEFYMFASFTTKLPWGTCDNDQWNTANCSLKWPLVPCQPGQGQRHGNGTCHNKGQFLGVWNVTMFEEVTHRKRVSPSEEYWTNHVLDKSSGIFSYGSPRWHLVLCLMLAWLVTFLCLLKGIKTTGKVVYFTAVFPYVVLVILFFRGVTLRAAVEGIKFYIIPDFSRLLDAKVWRDAGNQIFYSLGAGWGGLITLSSYNRFHNNALRDSLIVSLGNSLTSLFGGFVIFSFLGHMASEMNVDVSKVVTSGPGLAFIVYPEAVTRLPASPFWSVLFFFMLILLGLDSQFATVETVLTGILDQWPQFRRHKTLVILGICVALFLLGLPLTTNSGVYLLNLMDTYAASWSLMVVGLMEVVAVAWVYGCDRFLQDMQVMFGSKPSLWWKVCWCGLTPALIVFILLFAIVDYSPATYGDYSYPASAEGMGWCMVLASLVWIPGCALYKLYTEDEGKSFLQKIRLQSLPNRYWGPALVQHRKLINYVEDFVVDPEGEKRQLALYVNKACTVITAREEEEEEWEEDYSVCTRDQSLTTISYDEDAIVNSRMSLETAL